MRLCLRTALPSYVVSSVLNYDTPPHCRGMNYGESCSMGIVLQRNPVFHQLIWWQLSSGPVSLVVDAMCPSCSACHRSLVGSHPVYISFCTQVNFLQLLG